jgi:UDP-N-acetylglucosamine transferase subunit ALG13
VKKLVFVTIGTQEPFDRLIRLVDNWAKSKNNIDIFAQIGDSKFIPDHIDYKHFLDKREFDKIFNNSDLIVAHAGIGSIITALRNGKPILTLPRKARFKEHRNDHQIATTKALSKLGYIYPIYTEKEIINALNKINNIKAQKKIGEFASKELIDYLKEIINE